jgi:outer membrane protein assembly factor BamB
VPQKPKPKHPKAPGIVWPMYGFDAARLRVATGVADAPPFRTAWVFHARALVEFPPAIAYGRLYFANNAGFFFAVDAITGKRVWRYASGRCQAMSPAVDGGLVFAAFLNKPPCNASSGDGELVAFAQKTGKVRWIKHIGPSESSPLVRNGRVFVGDWDGVVSCFAERTGRLLWTFQADGKVKDGLAFSDGKVYFGTYGSSVYALEARTGALAWKAGAQPGLLGSGRFYATPAVAYDRVYIGATDGKVYSYGATTGELRWSQSTGGYVYSSPAVWDERIYAGSYSGRFYCFDAATGAVLWSFQANGSISGSPTIVGGRVYFATLERRTYALDARSGRELWSFPDGKYTPVVAEPGRLFLIGYAKIYALDPAAATTPKSAGARKPARKGPTTR